jgi:hypothetical protein
VNGGIFLTENQLIHIENKISEVTIFCEPGEVVLSGNDELLLAAKEFTEYVKGLEVTDENIKKAKKFGALIRNKISEIENERKGVKEKLLEPYHLFEKEIKELTSEFKIADDLIRNQVRELEEIERKEKNDLILSEFQALQKRYGFPDYINFYRFMQPKYLNKGVTLKSIKEEMANFFEHTKNELDVLNNLSEQDDLRNLALFSYYQGNDLSGAIRDTQKEIEAKKAFEGAKSEALNENKGSRLTEFDIEQVKTFFFPSLDEYNMAVRLLRAKEIQFRVKD